MADVSIEPAQIGKIEANKCSSHGILIANYQSHHQLLNETE